jgi:hypothetical protein
VILTWEYVFMNRYLWLLVIGVLVLVSLGIYHVASPLFQATTNNIRGMAPPPPMRVTMQVQNPSIGTDKESGFAKVTLHQGDAGTLRMTFTRQYTIEKVTVKLYFYGRAPNFDIWENTWNSQNMSLPDGITSSIEPSMLELSTDTPCSVDLTIVASPNAQIGDFKLLVDAWMSPTKTGNGTSSTDKPLMLEIVPKT